MCVSLMACMPLLAGVYGADDRVRPEALLDEKDEQRYSATQVVACRRRGGKERVAAGNLAGNFTHGVSIAHLFHDQVRGADYAARDCVFEVRDRHGKVLDRVDLKRLKTLWQSGVHMASNDLAMFELARRPLHVSRLLSLEVAPVSVGQELLLVTFHYDVQPYLSKRKTRGRVYSTLGATDAGMRNIFNTDVDAVPMSSGGPLYDREGRLVALIQGESSRSRVGREFAASRDFNSAIRLDAEFRQAFAEFVGASR
jgi:hypothetical protein